MMCGVEGREKKSKRGKIGELKEDQGTQWMKKYRRTNMQFLNLNVGLPLWL